MKKEWIFTDDYRADLTQQNIEIARGRVQGTVNRFLELNLEVPITKDLFNKLISDPDETVKSIYKERIPLTDPYTGLNNDREAILRSLVLPDLKPLRAACDGIKKDDFFYLFDVTADGEVVINSERQFEYLERFRVYANNKLEAQLHEKLKKVETGLNDLNSFAKFLPYAGKSIIEFDLGEMFSFSESKLRLRIEYYKQLARRLQPL
jgi:hypothetical protein